MEWLMEGFASLQAALFETVFQPLAFAIGLGGVLEVVFDATGWLLVGLIQLALMLLLIAPLERWRHAEPLRDRHAVRIDMLYTLIHRLGLFRLVFFFTLEPGLEILLGEWRSAGFGTFHIEDVQDQVELGLMRGSHHEVARAYVLYRERRAQERAAHKEVQAPAQPTLHVLDGGQRVAAAIQLGALDNIIHAGEEFCLHANHLRFWL